MVSELPAWLSLVVSPRRGWEETHQEEAGQEVDAVRIQPARRRRWHRRSQGQAGDLNLWEGDHNGERGAWQGTTWERG